MIRRLRLALRLRRDERGVSALEFGLVAAPVIIMFLGLIELGFQAYLSSQLQGTLDQAARMVTVGAVTTTTVTTFVTDRMHQILPGATVTVTPKSYTDFSQVGKPEPITTDTAPLGVYNKGDCYLDINGNGKWDNAINGGTDGNGGGDDIVYYTATVTYPTLMPLGDLMGWDGDRSVTATMMMRNQPYAAQAQPATKCS